MADPTSEEIANARTRYEAALKNASTVATALGDLELVSDIQREQKAAIAAGVTPTDTFNVFGSYADNLEQYTADFWPRVQASTGYIAAIKQAAEGVAGRISGIVNSGGDISGAIDEYDQARARFMQLGNPVDPSVREDIFNYSVHAALEKTRRATPALAWDAYVSKVPAELADAMSKSRLETYCGIVPGKVAAPMQAAETAPAPAKPKSKFSTDVQMNAAAAVAGAAGLFSMVKFKKVLGVALCVAGIGLAVAAKRGVGDSWAEKMKTGLNFAAKPPAGPSI